MPRNSRGRYDPFTRIMISENSGVNTSNLCASENLLAVSARSRTVQLHNREALSLRRWPRLCDCDLIAIAQAERGRSMSRDIPVTLFETLVLSLVVQVIATHNNRASHLCRGDNAAKHTTADGDISSERAFLVNVRALDGLTRGLSFDYQIEVCDRNMLDPRIDLHEAKFAP